TSATVSAPPMALLTQSTPCGGSGCVVHMPFLPYTGTFSVTVSPDGAATLNATATLSPDVTGTLVFGTPFTVDLSDIGQSALLTFGVTSPGSQTVALYFSGVATNPSGSGYNVAVFSLGSG